MVTTQNLLLYSHRQRQLQYVFNYTKILSSSEQAENLNNELYQAIIIVMLFDINIINVASLTVQT